MLREQMINFLEAAVVFLLATNAASVLAALYAMRLVAGASGQGRYRIPARRHDPPVELTHGAVLNSVRERVDRQVLNLSMFILNK